MSFASEDFVRVIPTSIAPVFQFNGIPEAGIELWIENLTVGNSITYKFQDSDDGTTWVDRTVETSNCGVSATTFILPSGAQAIHLSRKKAYTRMLAAAPATTTASIRVTWSSPDASFVKYLSV